MPSIKQMISRIRANLDRAPQPPTQGTAVREKYENVSDLVNNHFSRHSDSNHACRETMSMALELVDGKPATIVETGSSAWGTNSSLLFDSYVSSFGGSFSSVDIRSEPSITLQPLCSNRSRFFCNDSVTFLKNWGAESPSIDLLYLDSWDVDWDDPLPSALHGLNEFLSIYPALKPGSILLVDDTPADSQIMAQVQKGHSEAFVSFTNTYGFPPGKGSLIKMWLRDRKIGREIMHKYQLLWII